MRQFDGLALGAAVDVIVDPAHPERRHTASDMRHHTNERFGVLFIFCVFTGAAGLAAIPFLLRFGQTMLREARYRQTHAH